MLIQIFKSVLLMSAVGGALSALLLCVKPITSKLFSPKWQYYIWLTVLIVMVLPVSFGLPKNTPDIPDIMTEQVQNVQTDIEVPADNQNTITDIPVQSEKFSVPRITLPKNIWEYLSAAWLFTAAVIMLTRITKYYLFLRAIRKHSSKDTSLAGIPKRLQVRRTDMLDAPLIIGLIKPVLYLPDTELSESDLNYILMHELTHYRRHDLLYKWAALIIKSVHWFNPFVYLVSKQIDLDCEVSCDFAVTSNLTQNEQNNYMNMILGLLANSGSQLRPLTTQMASSKKTLKRRFEMIRNKKKTSKFVSALSAVIAVVMLGTTVFASGVLSDMTTDDYIVEITKNGEKIELANKPFVENGEVYLPLREIFEKLNINNNISWDNRKIGITLSLPIDLYQNNEIIDTSKVEFFYEIKIGSDSIAVNPDSENGYMSYSANMRNVPVLRNGKTYITYDYMDYMLGGGTYSNQHHMVCSVYDKNGNLIYSSNNLSVGTIISNSDGTVFKSDDLKNPELTVDEFFRCFNDGDFALMKNYCTSNCISSFFRDGCVFGMTRAELTDIKIDTLEYAKSSNDFNVFVTVNMTPHENSVFDKSQTSTSFYVILERQPDSKYLINEFATGL